MQPALLVRPSQTGIRPFWSSHLAAAPEGKAPSAEGAPKGKQGKQQQKAKAGGKGKAAAEGEEQRGAERLPLLLLLL